MTYYSWYAKWEMEKEEREESVKEAREAETQRRAQAEIEKQAKIETAAPIIKDTEQPYKLYEDENGQLSFFETISKKKKPETKESRPMSVKDLLFEKEEDENVDY
jgi:hypothetical protein